jgi:hypothetical protein
MAFDKEAEWNEAEFHIELIFDSGRATTDQGLSMPPSAYIAMGSFSLDESGRPMITTREMSFETLQAQVAYLKATLDARLIDAKARFAASIPN